MDTGGFLKSVVLCFRQRKTAENQKSAYKSVIYMLVLNQEGNKGGQTISKIYAATSVHFSAYTSCISLTKCWDNYFYLNASLKSTFQPLQKDSQSYYTASN